jgi:hypothetical protein
MSPDIGSTIGHSHFTRGSQPLKEAQARGLAVSLGERLERALEVVAGLGVVERSPLAEDVLSELDEDRGPVRVEPLRRPLDHLVDDDAEGDGVALAALELGEQPDGDRLRALEGVVLLAAADAAALDDRLVVAPKERRMLAGLEESSVLFVSRIVHRGHSRPGHASILRGFSGRLVAPNACVHPGWRVEDEQGIYRGEVTEIMWALADIKVAVLRILGYIEGEDEDEEEEEEEDRPPDA